MSEIDNVVSRIKECEEVVETLDSSSVWHIVSKDCDRWVELLDSKWQDVGKPEILSEMRVQKIAYNYLLNIKNKYVEELKSLRDLLNKLSNTDSIIQKDYDNEV